MSDYWFDSEASEAERLEGDMELARLEAKGGENSRAERRMRQLRAAGKLAEASAACMHGGGYPTDSPRAEHVNDPRAGTKGFRCDDCGSWWDAEQVRRIERPEVGVWLSDLREVA